METKMVVKSVTMPPEMASRLELRAERERRSFAQIVRMLIEKAERGDPYPAIPEAPADCDMEE